MKKIFILTVLISFYSQITAQHVGINTTTPQATLDIRGSQRVGGINNYVHYDSTGSIVWSNSNLYVPISQFLIKHSAAREGLYFNRTGKEGGQLEYRNEFGNPVFYTNSTNGQGYFSGNVGIGTTTPSTRLHIFQGASGTDPYAEYSPLTVESNSNTYLNLLSPAANETALLFGSGTSTNGVIMYNNSATPNGFQFRTSGNVTRMVIDNSGNVGIGTDYPSRALSFPAVLAKKISLYPGATGDAGFGVFGNELRVHSDYSGADITFGYDDFALGFTERIRMKGNGNVGIGISNPIFKLDVRKGSINVDSTYHIGTITVLATPGVGNVFIGKDAGRNNIEKSNTFCGDQAGYSNTRGHENSFFGNMAGYANTIAWGNSFFGVNSGSSNIEGRYNSFFGDRAGNSNIYGERNTIVGSQADVSTDGLFNATAIGYNAVVNASYKIRLGNSAVTVIEGQVAYTFPSDGRFKTNVTETVKGLDFILKLRPVVYNFQARKMDEFISGKTSSDARFASLDYAEGENIRQSGFIAQEVEKAARETGYDFNGVVIPKNEKGIYSLAYSQFVVPLVKAVQELQATIEQQNKMAEQQNRRIEMLLKEITQIKAKMK